MRFLPALFKQDNKQWIMFMTEKDDESGKMAELFDLSKLNFDKIVYSNRKEAQDAWKHEVSFSRVELFAVPLSMFEDVCKTCKATGITMIPKQKFKFLDPTDNDLTLAEITDLSLKITIS